MVLENNNRESAHAFAYGTITLFGPAFQLILLARTKNFISVPVKEQEEILSLLTADSQDPLIVISLRLTWQSLARLPSSPKTQVAPRRFGLFPVRSPLLRECANCLIC